MTIGEREILSTALSSGLSGGNGEPVVMHVDNAQFDFDSTNRLILADLGNEIIKFFIAVKLSRYFFTAGNFGYS